MNDEYFGKQLRILREQLGLTLQELADILHTSKQVLSRYETGQRVPKISVANEYALILGVPLSYFMPNPPEWHPSIWEDFCHARSDEERMEIINSCGLDPRAYEIFLQMKAEQTQIVPPLRLDDEERALIMDYRSLDQASRGELRGYLHRLVDEQQSKSSPQPREA